MKIVIVDEEDNVVGVGDRLVVDEKGLRYRVSVMKIFKNLVSLG